MNDQEEEPWLYYVWKYIEWDRVSGHLEAKSCWNTNIHPQKGWMATHTKVHRSSEDCAWELIGLNKKLLT